MRNIGLFFIYMLGGAVLGGIIGRIIVQFVDKNAFMHALAIIMGMLLGVVIASKIKQANNISILIGIVCGAVVGFFISGIFEELLFYLADLTNVKVYVNPAEISSFGIVYGAIFGVLAGMIVFVLVSLNVSFDASSAQDSAIAPKNDAQETEQIEKKPKQAPLPKVAQTKEVRAVPNPLLAFIRTPSGIALALGAKVAAKCNKTLDDDTILLLAHIFGEPHIDELGDYADMNAVYSEILRTQKDDIGNIKFLCSELARMKVAHDDKIAFVKTLLILSFGYDESVASIVFSISVNIGLDSEAFFGIKQDIEASLQEAYSGEQNVAFSGISQKDNIEEMYEILEVTPNDSNEAIKKSYRALVAKYHPDKYASKELPEDMVKYAEERFKDIKRAYDVLKKERKIT